MADGPIIILNGKRGISAHFLNRTCHVKLSDNLWIEHEISRERPYDGPFYVEVEDAIQEFFE